MDLTILINMFKPEKSESIFNWAHELSNSNPKKKNKKREKKEKKNNSKQGLTLTR